MREMSKKGDEKMIWTLVIIVMAMIVMILVINWVANSIKTGQAIIDPATKCAAMGKGAGCFAESAIDQQESDGFTCKRGWLGCKEDSQAPYCCYRI
jgi:hypothetical protein